MPRDDTRPTGHRPIDAKALGQPVRSGDVIAAGRGPHASDAELIAAANAAADVHGTDVVVQALRVRCSVAIPFLAWLQGREHAGHCEVSEAAALPRGQHGSGDGCGLPVPSSALVGQGVEDLLRAIMDDSRVLDAFSEWLTFTRGGV